MIEVNLSKCRFMLFTNNNKLVTENHNQGITWKKVYKNECGNMKALCFQLIPSGKKVFAAESPTGEYWTFEEFVAIAGQSVPTHISRSICSQREPGLWDITTIGNDNSITRTVMTDNEIGYETRVFINAVDKEHNRKYGR